MRLTERRGNHGTARNRHFPGRAAIDAYGNGGFRFAEMSHRGSILCLPSGIHGWDVTEAAQVTVESLAGALAESSEYDVLLIGSGREIAPLRPDIANELRERGVRFDVMPTGAAARTYNIMVGENRKVAAALIAVP